MSVSAEISVPAFLGFGGTTRTRKAVSGIGVLYVSSGDSRAGVKRGRGPSEPLLACRGTANLQGCATARWCRTIPELSTDASCLLQDPSSSCTVFELSTKYYLPSLYHHTVNQYNTPYYCALEARWNHRTLPPRYCDLCEINCKHPHSWRKPY
eukprot:2636174-Rhodomonas_salina.1